MNNKKIKKSLFLSFLLFSFCPLFAKIPITLCPEIGIMNGNIYEYVFLTDCKNTNNMVSMLDWQIKNVPYIRLQGQTTLFKYLDINADFKFITNIESGVMQDYDWLNSLPPSGPNNEKDYFNAWLNDDPTELTNYSCHPNTLEKMICFNFNLGTKLGSQNITFSPLLSWDYQNFGFMSKDGYLRYKSSDFRAYKNTGKAIGYKLESNALMIGFNLNAKFSSFQVSSQVLICPCLNKLVTLDTHFVNRENGGTLYLDEYKNFFELKSNFNFSYNFQKNQLIGLNFNFEYRPLIKGDAYATLITSNGYKLSPNWEKLPSNGGSKKFIWAFGLNYSIKL